MPTEFDGNWTVMFLTIVMFAEILDSKKAMHSICLWPLATNNLIIYICYCLLLLLNVFLLNVEILDYM